MTRAVATTLELITMRFSLNFIARKIPVIITKYTPVFWVRASRSERAIQAVFSYLFITWPLSAIKRYRNTYRMHRIECRLFLSMMQT